MWKSDVGPVALGEPRALLVSSATMTYDINERARHTDAYKACVLGGHAGMVEFLQFELTTSFNAL